MKKIIRTFSLATLVTVASVSAASADAFKGFYIGAQGGWQHAQTKFKSAFGNYKDSQNRVLLGANLGVSTVASNNVFIAGEADLDFSLGEHNNIFRPGITGKLGYRFTPNFVVAAKAGAVYSKVISSHHFKGRWGFAPGVEALFAVTDHNIVGFSYQHNIYKKSHSWYGTTIKPTSHDLTVKYAYKF